MSEQRVFDTEDGLHGMGRQRDAGVLMHVSSLPGPYGIGDLGPAAYAWVDALRRARQTWWQILPLGPPGRGNSPYNALSAFAGNPNLISPEALRRVGLLRKDEMQAVTFSGTRVEYRRVTRFKAALMTRAWERFRGGAAGTLRPGFEQFCASEADWLDDYALFMALKETTKDAPCDDWPKDWVFRRPAALRNARRELADSINRHRFTQFLFNHQWNDLRRYARRHRIRLIGDLPMFLSADSADVWAHPELFQLDGYRRPAVVAGVPPDYFSRTGQRWGNPLYNWKAMRRDGYAWWINRLQSALSTVDVVRIDHFRGFEACWEIPAGALTAQTGHWVKVPGIDLFLAVGRALGTLPFIAEDLGVITPQVRALRDALGLPGMRVLQFAFDEDAASPHLPHHHVPNSVVYTGTHDNDTAMGWFGSLNSKGRRCLRGYLPHVDEDMPWTLIRLAWASIADHAIVPLQDILGLGSDARMNVPGRGAGNWRWRLQENQLSNDHLDRLGALTAIFGRVLDATAGADRGGM